MIFLDCTLRDGGYYNAWDFSFDLINQYLNATEAAGVDVVELGFRSLKNQGFQGPCAFTTDEFISSLNIPASLAVSVMVNGNELVGEVPQQEALKRLFPNAAADSPVGLVRIACHVHEFEAALPAVTWLKERGYQVGINLMQVADRSEAEVKALARQAKAYPLDALYFADSMGSMNPDQAGQIIQWFRSEWTGSMGIHTHDNLGLALSNTLRALDEGVTWVDSTVTGMGRGPGNARTEELAMEIAERRGKPANLVPLMMLLREHFTPMQAHYGWGTNPYYYLAGKYGIHPTYIQEMLSDSRYSEEDVLAVIEHLRVEGGKKFSLNTLDAARHFYHGEPKGRWSPRERFAGREVLLLGTGPGVARHRVALERYIRDHQPLVLALNTQRAIDAELIDLRVACHPVRLLADCGAHTRLPQPLITPYSMLPVDVRDSLGEKEVLDFGLNVQAECFEFADMYCTAPTSLVMAYAFAIAASGGAARLYLAGFDGYPAEDPRNAEMNRVVEQFQKANDTLPLIAITPSRYNVTKQSVYGMDA
ncbi:aldolase catalytic domain-containing protein [Halomonas saccharevitans]|uniref:Aldolase catalytic domain-containing protein n=1 Tax=Halomonas saccharevitans TaxID=416872 RepID=A0ABU3NAT4_9GAMM|nr:aldolase catalytic domain-containing protein [Halomonas saccharevitans]MDT8878315.1 aldolase catalytic domain-containing protein [Halomonas saccharevitans]